MSLHLNKNYHLCSIESGVALFDAFTNDTHFITFPLSWLIERLKGQVYTTENLLSDFLVFHSSALPLNNNLTKVDTSTQFQQFITEAKKSGIIIATD